MYQLIEQQLDENLQQVQLHEGMEQHLDENLQQVQLHKGMEQHKDGNPQQVQLQEVEAIETPQPLLQQTTIQCVPEQNMVLKNKPIYNCEICNKQYKSNISLQKHYIHKSGKPYICDVCSKRFLQKSSLITHYLVHYKKPQLCTACNQPIPNENILQDHSLIYSGLRKPFVCNVCKKRFWKKSTLPKHYLTHTCERNYKCEICDEIFAETCSLITHLYVHLKDREIKLEPLNNNIDVLVDVTPEKGQQLVQETQNAMKQQCYVRQRLNEYYDDEIAQSLDPRCDQTTSFVHDGEEANLMSYYESDQEELQQIEYEMSNKYLTPKLRHLVESNKQDDNKQEASCGDLGNSSKNISMTLNKESSTLSSYDNTIIIKLEIDIESDIEEQASSLLGNSTIKGESPLFQLDATLNEQSSNGACEVNPVKKDQSSSSLDGEC